MVRKNRAIGRVFHVALDLHDAARPLRIDEDLVQHSEMPHERLRIVCAWPEHQNDAAQHFANHRRGVRNQNDPNAGAADDQHFGGLHQNPGIPPLEQKTAQHGSEHEENPEKSQHKGCQFPYRQQRKES